MRSCSPGMLARAVEPPRHGLVERVDQQRGLAAAGDAGDAGEEARAGSRPSRSSGCCARAPITVSDLAVGLRRAFGIGICRTPVRYWPVMLSALAMISSGVPCATTWPPWTPAPGPMSTTWSAVRIASSSCSTTITVLPMSRRCLQRLQQPGVVALVQADGGLVQHVEHAGQPRADLRGEPDALALAARQRAGRARQRQIVEPDVDQELQPLADLLEDAGGDLVLLLGQLLRQLGEPRVGGADRHIRRPGRCAGRRS